MARQEGLALHTLITPDSPIAHPTGPAQLGRGTITELAAQGRPWASMALDAHQTGVLEPQKGTKKMAKALTMLTVDHANSSDLRNGQVFDNRARDAIHNVYAGLDQKIRKHPHPVNPEYARAIATEVIPTLLTVNGVTNSDLAESGHNSVGRVVATVEALLYGPDARDNGGTVRFVSQMCAQYASGEDNAAEAFSKGLADRLDSKKIGLVYQPMRQIAEVLNRFGIRVEIVNPQITADPRLMLAMVPAGVWKHIDEGRVGEMVSKIDKIAADLPPHAQAALGITERTDGLLSYRAPSLAEPFVGETSVIDDTLAYAELFGQYFNHAMTYPREVDPANAVDWKNIKVRDISSVRDEIDRVPGLEEDILARTKREHGWSDDKFGLFTAMKHAHLYPGWGTFDDTVRFYGREVTRRAQSKAESWKRTMDFSTEQAKLIADPSFHPELSPEERQTRAQEILKWTDTIANMEIGGRTIFNVALYAALATHAARLNQHPDIAIIWPIEEENDRCNVRELTDVHQKVTEQRFSDIPLIYPGKHLRQPLGN